ncbi:CHAD domain-containing protein [Streptomyces sp. NPDC051018]|uniref:CHAD domain-containing protein n=1 Tax=Streptomyces sp. NPDC051018 TaxID=3365639 RepID=UPI00379AAE4A
MVPVEGPGVQPGAPSVPPGTDGPAPAPVRDSVTGPAGDTLAAYLHARAGDFLRSLRLHDESGADTAAVAEAARCLRMASRRISGTLHTFRPLLDPVWADGLRAELAWLSATLAREHACTSQLNRLLDALSRLSGTPLAPAPRAGRQGAGPAGAPGQGAAMAVGTVTVGAARAGALLERQLTLARTRAHSAALQALGSSRFHAVADAVAVLASELPLGPVATAPATEVLFPSAEMAERRLLEAVTTLPLSRAGHPYNADALVHGLAAAPAEESQDAPWHQVRRLLRLHRYALEVLETLRPNASVPVLNRAGRLLDRHRDAAEAAEAAASAARTPRIAPATAYALGVLHADQRHEVEAARFAFQEIWPGSIAVKARA